MKLRNLFYVLLLSTSAVHAQSDAPTSAAPRQLLGSADAAARFGALESVLSAQLSPDGTKIVYVAPHGGTDTDTAILVGEVKPEASPRPILAADSQVGRIRSCGFASNDRLVCGVDATRKMDNMLVGFSRHFSLDLDGKNLKWLAQARNADAQRISQFDGEIVDWLSGADANVLMMRDFVPTERIGSIVGESRNGYGVVRIDTRTLHTSTVENPVADAVRYMSDGRGTVRMIVIRPTDSAGMLTGKTLYRYRLANSRDWKPFSTVIDDSTDGLNPIAIDPITNSAYAVRSLNGRDALYRVALDGTLHEELVQANAAVDVDEVVSIGRNGRVIGTSYVTDRRNVDYFDPAYKALAPKLSRALPGAPEVQFVGSSADENVLLVWAGSDTQPGMYLAFNRTTHHLDALTLARPELAGVALAPMQSITYRAADGTMVPAYLTLPPAEFGKPIAGIVMPHGGPASRDEWGFDWLVQFFAHRGYAVIQPQFRGSAGYGDAWFADNGFKSWRLAIGDVTASAHYLIDQHIVPADKLAIIGWSYGGYAALQSGVVEPDLFRAIGAIAPATDLGKLKDDSSDFTNHLLIMREIGSGPHIEEGSPARHAAAIKAPVMLFHGDMDSNVAVQQSQAMDAALRRAGKQSSLTVFHGLNHQLYDSIARATVLRELDAFVRRSLAIPTP